MNREFYDGIKDILESARNKVYQTANFAMVEAYWQIGKSIIEEQGGEERAEYGAGLLRELSRQMTKDFGKGFTVANLKNMRQFYLTFPNGYALRSELSWTHYRLLMRVENETARQFYLDEAVKSQWSTRQLERRRILFVTHMSLSSLGYLRTMTFTKVIWNRRLLLICKNFCWSWDADSRLWQGKRESPLMDAISELTLFFTITF